MCVPPGLGLGQQQRQESVLAVAQKPQGADLRASITSTMRARKETEGGRICNKNIRHGPQVVMLEGCFGRILIFAQRDRTRTLL